jgi:hypothetical protein
MLVSKTSSLQRPAEDLGRVNRPLSAPSVTLVIPVMSHVAAGSPAMRPRAPLDLVHSTSNAARATTRAREFLS